MKTKAVTRIISALLGLAVITGVLNAGTVNVYAAEKSDEQIVKEVFDAKYYAAHNPDVVIAKGDSAGDLATSGVAPKAWIRRGGKFLLLKDGEVAEVEAELAASRIARCFRVDQVLYEPREYEGLAVSASGLMADKAYEKYLSIVATLFQSVVTVRPQNPRALSAEALCEAAKPYCTDCTAAGSFGEAAKIALEKAGEDGVVAVCGSFYMIGDLKKYLI